MTTFIFRYEQGQRERVMVGSELGQPLWKAHCKAYIFINFKYIFLKVTQCNEMTCTSNVALWLQ